MEGKTFTANVQIYQADWVSKGLIEATLPQAIALKRA